MSGDLLGKVCSLGFKRGTKLGPDAEEFDLRGLRPVDVVGWAPPPQLQCRPNALLLLPPAPIVREAKVLVGGW
jgi:hypothetical protein